MNDRSVVITGFGIVSPLGCSVAEVTRRFCAGESAIGPLTGMGVEGAVGAIIRDIPLPPAAPRSGRLDRVSRLFLSASYLAIQDAGVHLDTIDAARLGLSFGTGLGCLLTNAEYNQKIVDAGPGAASPQLFAYTVSNAAAGEVSIALGIKGASVTMHAGLAAGLQAIGYGADLVRSGAADVVLAGGADALGAALLRGLDDMALLRHDGPAPLIGVHAGVVPAEAAVVMVLERATDARQRGARIWASLDGYAAGFEPTLTHRDRECTGIQATLSRALTTSGRHAAEIGLVMTSAAGTGLDDVEHQALAAVCGGATDPLVFAPKRATGECFGASGPLALALAVAMLQRPAPRLQDGVARQLHLTAAAVHPNGCLESAGVAMVHSLCYSGTCVAVLAGRER